MKQNPDYYSDCQFFIGSLKYGAAKALRYETEPLAGKFCVPSGEALQEEVVKTFKAEFDKYFLDTGFAQYFSDIAATSGLLSWTLLTAFLIGFVYLIVLRLCGGPMVWISIVALILGNAYGGYMLF